VLHFQVDKPSVTADPTDRTLAYAMWDTFNQNNKRDEATFTRTIDGGVTWEPARSIFTVGGNDETIGHQVVVLPGGHLVALFSELHFLDSSGGSGRFQTTLSSMRSTDKGQTWSSVSRGPSIPIFNITDPDTGYPVVNAGSSPLFSVAVDRNNGNLYAVWEDTGFTSGQYSSIAFSMSSDGGLTWFAPIRVNQTPQNIAPLNRQAWMPSIAVAADGTIAVSYYDFRLNDPNSGALTDVWLVHCHASAATPAADPVSWSNEVRLTGSSFDIEQAPAPFGAYFMGDYQGLTAVGNDFLTAWSQPYGTDPDSIFFRRVGP